MGILSAFTYLRDSLFELFHIHTWAACFIHVREYEILNTYDGVVFNDFVYVVYHLLEGNVIGEWYESQLGAPFLYLERGVSLQILVLALLLRCLCSDCRSFVGTRSRSPCVAKHSTLLGRHSGRGDRQI